MAGVVGAEAHGDRSHLKNSRQLAWTRTAADEAASTAINHLLWQLEEGEQRGRARRSTDRERLRSTLEPIVLDLYCSAKEAAGQFLAYSRRKGDYGATGEHPAASLTAVAKVVGFLDSAGYITTRPGCYSRGPGPFEGTQTGKGYRSRMRAQPLLIDLLEGMFGVTPASVGVPKAAAGRPIRLRATGAAYGERGRVLRFKETVATAAMALAVTEANRLRANSAYSFDGPKPGRCDLTRIHLHRTFLHGRWDRGGRLSGGWWQELPAMDRTRILIDGEEAVELDFRALHPRMCFHLEGLPLAQEVDPYSLHGQGPEYREAAKTAFLQLLNVSPQATPRRPKELQALFSTTAAYGAFVAEMEAALQPIRPWLRSGPRGVELQFLDSEIASGIIAELTAQGVPCLPIHDSFIVPRSAEASLGRAMCEVYRDQMAVRSDIPAYPAISGWSNPSMEQAVRGSLTAL